MRIYNVQKWKEQRQDLRRESTAEEIVLWEYLKGNKIGARFRRQFGIGCYIADFYCPEKKIAIELDGKQHLQNKEYDEERDRFFNSCYIKVLRFKNEEVLDNVKNVLVSIDKTLKTQIACEAHFIPPLNLEEVQEECVML
ncbi:MAG: endonuclease domain-containing protein [Candidatus Taylorbacteria bacterium]|nr:endonuclease domain-containing protein [Candidatus Taylorbacteria bacterium]